MFAALPAASLTALSRPEYERRLRRSPVFDLGREWRRAGAIVGAVARALLSSRSAHAANAARTLQFAGPAIAGMRTAADRAGLQPGGGACARPVVVIAWTKTAERITVTGSGPAVFVSARTKAAARMTVNASGLAGATWWIRVEKS